jgi:hypothetical protein
MFLSRLVLGAFSVLLVLDVLELEVQFYHLLVYLVLDVVSFSVTRVVLLEVEALFWVVFIVLAYLGRLLTYFFHPLTTIIIVFFKLRHSFNFLDFIQLDM